jgi:hypothetical protein
MSLTEAADLLRSLVASGDSAEESAAPAPAVPTVPANTPFDDEPGVAVEGRGGDAFGAEVDLAFDLLERGCG